MKCEVCLERLEEYLDGELAAGDREQVTAHLIACGDCSAEFDLLGEEQELFGRYDREVEVPPFLWTRIAARMPVARQQRRWFDLVAVPVGAMAIIFFAITISTTDKTDKKNDQRPDQSAKQIAMPTPSEREVVASKPKPPAAGG